MSPYQSTLAEAAGQRAGDSADLDVSTETPAVVEDPATDPFESVENGKLALPNHETWSCSGIVHQPDANAHSVSWKGSHAVPGYEWSENALVVVETGDNPGGPYQLALFPFDGDGDARGFPQPRLVVNEYDRLRDALVNVEQALSVLADRDPGEPVAIAGIEDRT